MSLNFPCIQTARSVASQEVGPTEGFLSPLDTTWGIGLPDPYCPIFCYYELNEIKSTLINSVTVTGESEVLSMDRAKIKKLKKIPSRLYQGLIYMV